MARRYRVKMPVFAAAPGDEVTASPDDGADYAALVEGGFLEEIEPTVPCPACEADKKVKDVPSFKKAETLSEHYSKEHPALAVPDFEEVV